MYKINCDICGESFYKKSHLSCHDIDNITDYYYKLLFDQYDYDVDKVINLHEKGYSVADIKDELNYKESLILKIFDFKNVKRRTCKESKHIEKYKKKYEDSIIKKYGVDNISKSEIIKKQKIRTMLKNYGRINNFCDDDIRNYAQSHIDYDLAYKLNLNTIISKYGVDNVSKIDFVRKKISDKQKEKFSNLSDKERFDLTKKCRTFIKHKRISKLEMRIHSILEDFNIEYSSNSFTCGYYVDLKFDKNILEVMGDFWHGNPKLYKSDDILNFPYKKIKAKELWLKDRIKKEKLEKRGFKVHYLWETDIRKMSDIDILNFITNIIEK